MVSKARVTRPEREADRDAQAARLRALRLTYGQIAEQLGYADASGAWRAAQRGRNRAVREPHHDMVLMDLAELDEMAREAWKVLRNTHYIIDRGDVVRLDGAPLLDDAPVLAAIAKLLDIQTRRERIVGHGAPIKSQVKVVTEDAIDSEIQRLEDELADRSSPREAT